jgi:hypothetical protein
VALDSVPREALALIAAIALAIALIQALTSAARRWARRRRMSLRMERAADGERRAAGMLEDQGFTLLGAQVEVEHAVQVDGKSVSIALRADYLVESREGARYVVEVKTGAAAPHIETSATRRQILEYRVAFDVDGVLLVDAETGRIHEVTFPALSRLSRLSRLSQPPVAGWRIAAVAIAALAALVALVR